MYQANCPLLAYDVDKRGKADLPNTAILIHGRKFAETRVWQ